MVTRSKRIRLFILSFFGLMTPAVALLVWLLKPFALAVVEVSLDVRFDELSLFQQLFPLVVLSMIISSPVVLPVAYFLAKALGARTQNDVDYA